MIDEKDKNFIPKSGNDINIDPIQFLTDDEIDSILRKAKNVNIPGSFYQKAKIESEIRHRKKIESSLKTPNISIGILNRSENFDIGIPDDEKNALARKNRFNRIKIRWWEKTWVQILFLIGAIASIIAIVLSLYPKN